MAGPQTPVNLARLRRRATQAWRPQTGVDASQGAPFASDPSLVEAYQQPLDPGVNLSGWINPYSFTIYQLALSTTQALRMAPPNLRRCYLIMQNQGPGNVFVNFGQDAVVPTLTLPSNCLQLITTQFYEQIGGGGFNFDTGNSQPNAFVSPDYVSAITDTAGTTMIIGEGVWINRQFSRGN